MEIIPSNFIEQAVLDDIKTKNLKKIITRYPPEPNGFMHIGHAKAFYIDYSVAKKFKGYTNYRFDDTNPAKEDTKYVKGLLHDTKWLGLKWKKVLFASDYYDFIYQCALDFIRQGKAYVCDLTPDEVTASRGTLTTPGTNSPYRDRSIEENLDLFENMKKAKFADGEKTLRAKIDMSHPNMNMRDPIIYRILRATHFRTGEKWCIYPMYDFAHPLSDAHEGITHSLCSLEYEDHRPLYNWVVENCRLVKHCPRQIEFARLNIEGTVLSKRYLLELVDSNYVDGWDDPRMPTICGMRRRGYPAGAIIEFCKRIGVAKSNSLVKPHILEACVRENLNNVATRVMGVIDPLKIVLTNYPENKKENILISNNPTIKNCKKHKVTFEKEIFIEKEDFMENPTPKFFRLAPEGVVRLIGAYIIRCDKVVKNKKGEIDHLNCSIIYDASEQGIKPKGTIHWIGANSSKKVLVRTFSNILKEGEVYEKGKLDEIFNTNSMKLYTSYVEPFALKQRKDKAIQFVRMGYYIYDKSSTKNVTIFNETISLKDSK